MTSYVLDASVAAKWFTDEEHAEAAARLLREDVTLWAPDFFVLEMDNLTCKWIRRGQISTDQGREVRSVLDDCRIHYCPCHVLRDLAWDIANTTQRAFYDALYVALALFLEIKVVTADHRLYASLAQGPFLKSLLWIGDIDGEQDA